MEVHIQIGSQTLESQVHSIQDYGQATFKNASAMFFFSFPKSGGTDNNFGRVQKFSFFFFQRATPAPIHVLLLKAQYMEGRAKRDQVTWKVRSRYRDRIESVMSYKAGTKPGIQLGPK